VNNLSSIHTGEIWGEELPLIPEKIYDLGYLDYSTSLMMGKNPKLVIRFQIVEQGDSFGVVLSKYYGVSKLKGKPKKYGIFQVGRKSNFLRDFLTLFPDQSVKRLDRIPMTRFQGVIIKGQVKTVSKGYNQRKIPEPLQYSVIGDLLKIKTL
jgi:hypothetical protein